MGAWGIGAFENDEAGDWVWELEDDTDASILVTALREVADADADAYLGAPECSIAIAAADIVASARGARSPALPTEAIVWLDARGHLVDEDLVGLATVAVARVATASELRALWDEETDEANPESWHQQVAALLARLR